MSMNAGYSVIHSGYGNFGFFFDVAGPSVNPLSGDNNSDIGALTGRWRNVFTPNLKAGNSTGSDQAGLTLTIAGGAGTGNAAGGPWSFPPRNPAAA